MRWRVLALVVATLALLLLAVAGPGTRAGLWDFRTGFVLLRWAVYVGVAGVLLGLVALAAPSSRRAGLGVPALAVAMAAVAVLVPFSLARRARGLPPIHDVTTDTADPPAFVAVLPLRAAAPNDAAYGGDSIARLQRAAYPDVRPLDLAVPPAAALARAAEAARAMGWRIVAVDSGDGRLEATATTRWFGFEDDVVVRVRPAGAAGAGSRVDVRSVSRVGRGDAGANAARVRAFLGRLRGA